MADDWRMQATNGRHHLMSAPSSTITLMGMTTVMDSPYEKGTYLQSAEVNEKVFEQVKGLIAPYNGHSLTQRSSSASTVAQRFFGEQMAHRITETYSQIDASGLIYGSGWSKGIIRERNCGRIPKELLLLCLQDQRLASCNTSHSGLLRTIVDELELCKDLISAMESWDLIEKYPRTASCKDPSVFGSTHQVQCLKCIIFVCRAWHAARIMKQPNLDRTLMGKIEDCMYILDSNARETIPLPPMNLLRPSTGLATIPTMNPQPPTPTEEVSPQRSINNDTNQGLLSPPDPAIGPTHRSSPSSVDSKGSSPVMFGDNLVRQQWYEDCVSPRSKLTTFEKQNYWYPMDPKEKYLNPTEIEMAWLLEESFYCTRQRDINWVFISHFASPTLATQLVRLSKPSDLSQDKTAEDERKLSALIRMHFAVVKDRFAVVRLDVRKKLLTYEYRPAMRLIIPILRQATNPFFSNIRREQQDYDSDSS